MSGWERVATALLGALVAVEVAVVVGIVGWWVLFLRA
jgi:hypothetical protein